MRLKEHHSKDILLNEVSTELQRRRVEQGKADLVAERHARDGITGFAVVDNQGRIVRRFKQVANAQTFLAKQTDPDRFAIQHVGNADYHIKQIARDIASGND